jgi:hypothetical protein
MHHTGGTTLEDLRMITGVPIVLVIRHVNARHLPVVIRAHCLVVELLKGYTLWSIIVSGLHELMPGTTMTALCGRRREMYGAHQYEVLQPGILETLREINVSGRTLAAIPDCRPWSLGGCLRVHR